MTAQLYVVATPIGHLDDISMRALQVLREVALIAAEDTRQSMQLLKHFNINTPLTACHDHNESLKTEAILQQIQAGESVALISDAGTPLISDPGYRLVSAAQQAGIRVTPIPGACAAVAALSAVGLPSDRFTFIGFLPAKALARLKALQDLQHRQETLIFYEAPHRVLDTLQAMNEVFGATRQVGFAREITKTFETIVKKPLHDLINWVSHDLNQQKGEIVLVVSGASEPIPVDQDIDSLLKRLLQDLSVKSATQLAAELTGMKKKLVYQKALAIAQPTTSCEPDEQ